MSDPAAVDESLYKTWIPATPALAFSASGRTVAIAWRPPDAVYGEIAYDIQIAKQYQIDGGDEITDRTDPDNWFAPAANDTLIYALGETYRALLDENDPANAGYAYHYGDLPAAWHTDAASRRIQGTAYTAMVPLDQQTVLIARTKDGVSEEALGNSAENTTYYFRLRAVNVETGRMGEYSGDDGLGDAVTSCAVNAQDVVMGAINTAAIVEGSVTAEKMFVKELAAISVNMGVITDGALAGNAFNYWALSTILAQGGQIKYYPGEMRVGGSDQYFRVIPIVKDGIVLDYHVEFRAGSFTVNSSMSKINGEVIVTLNDNALDRTRITPQGTYYEHRSTPESAWDVIAQMTTAGVKSRNLYSSDSIVVANSRITDRRKNGSDIGLPYLSGDSEVYHFDTDFYNQKGLSTIDINYDGAQPSLVDETDNNGVIDFSTAILAVSPYSEIGKSIYGQFLIACTFTANTYTTEFWLKYVWNENQVLFAIGNINDTLILKLLNDEPYYNDTFDDVPYNNEVLESNQLVYNDIQRAHGEIVHQWQGGSEIVDLDSMGIRFEEEKWYHLAIIQSNNTIALYINNTKIDFTRTSSGPGQVAVNINESKGSIIIDELMIDKTTALPFDDFAANTVNKIPYAALDANDKWFILDAQDPDKVKINWLGSSAFRQAVQAIIQGQ
jgi:hypothetical protein